MGRTFTGPGTSKYSRKVRESRGGRGVEAEEPFEGGKRRGVGGPVGCGGNMVFILRTRGASGGL